MLLRVKCLSILTSVAMEPFDKKTLRRAVRARIAALDADEKASRSAVIAAKVEELLLACGARVVALFSSLPDEPQLWPLVERLAVGARVVLPRVEGDVMNFYDYAPAAMAIGSFCINEPQGVVPVESCVIDAMVVPGVVFSKNGARMGRGKGYYDKYMSLPGFAARKIGVCYEVQIVPHLPTEEHDVPMDAVVCG